MILSSQKYCDASKTKPIPRSYLRLCDSASALRLPKFIVNPRKLEHGSGMIAAGIAYTLPEGHADTDVPSFRLLP